MTNSIWINAVEINAAQLAAEMQYHPADNAEAALAQAGRALAIKELLTQEADRRGIEGEGEQKLDVLLEQALELPQADDAACHQYYVSNLSKFRSPLLVEARHILLAAPGSDDERMNTRSLARELIAQLQQHPETFAALAEQHSICPSRLQGGSLGQVSKGSTVAEFERQLFMLPTGLARDPVESRYGYHVVWVDRRVEGEQLPYEQVADKIRIYLEQRVFHRAFNQFVRQLAGQARIVGVDLAPSSDAMMQ